MTWVGRAACAESHLPTSAWTEQPQQGRWGNDRWGAAAIEVCRACPVVSECLAFIMRDEGVLTRSDRRWGIWGATTPGERAAIAHQRAEVAL